MAEIASAFVTLAPSARGFGRKLDSEISGDVTASGKKAGSGWGKAFGIGAALVVGAKALSFLGDSLGEAREAQVIGARTANVIKNMGNAANISAEGVGNLAGAISAKTGVDDEAIQSGQNLLLTFGNIRNEAGKGNDIFSQTSQLMVDMSAAMGTDAKSSAIQLGKALNDPIKGLSALSRVGVSFTAGQQEQIKALVENGQTMQAQKVILGELERQFGGAAASMATPADKAAVAWGNFKESIGTALLPVVDRLLTVFVNRIMPALTSFGGYVRANVVPAVASLGSLFGSGSNASGVFSDAIRTTVAAVRSLAQWVTGTVLPAVRDALLPVIARGRAEFAKLRASIQANRPQLAQFGNAMLAIGNFVATKVIPVLYKLQAQVLVNLITGVRFAINALSAMVSAFNATRAAIGNAINAVENFVKGVREKVGQAVTFVQGVPGKIQAVFTGAGTMLYNAGVQLMTGLASGIRNKIQDAINEVQAGLSRIKGLLPGSPIKWGPLKGWNNGGAGKRLMELVAEGIQGGSPKALKAAVSAFDKIEDALTTTRDNLKGTLEGLKGDFQSLADSVASAFTGNLFEATTGSDFIANLMGKRGELGALLASFKTLKGWGLAPAFLSQLFASGNGALITDLAGMGQAGASEAGALFGEVTSLGAQLGSAVATNDPISAEIRVTNQKLDLVVKQLSYLGGDIGKELNGAVVRGRKSGKRGKK